MHKITQLVDELVLEPELEDKFPKPHSQGGFLLDCIAIFIIINNTKDIFCL
jgi:hypothetical protein